MNNIELSSYGLCELNKEEANETNGGIVPLIIIGAALVLTSCATTRHVAGPPMHESDSTGR